MCRVPYAVCLVSCTVYIAPCTLYSAPHRVPLAYVDGFPKALAVLDFRMDFEPFGSLFRGLGPIGGVWGALGGIWAPSWSALVRLGVSYGVLGRRVGRWNGRLGRRLGRWNGRQVVRHF